MLSEAFTLLAAEECNEALPVAGVVDSFEYARFAPLEIVRDGQHDVAVFPTDRAVPAYVAALARRAWFPEPRGADRQGLPLLPAWSELDPRAQVEDPIRVEADDAAAFLADPGVRVGGGRLSVDLRPEHVRELTGYGRTLITDPEGERPPIAVTVKTESNIAPDIVTAPPQQMLVDLPSFLTRPVLTLAEGRDYPLAARHLRELVGSGSTTVELPGPEAPVSLRIMAANDGPALASISAPLKTVGARGSTGTIMTIEEHREAYGPRRIAPASVELPQLRFDFVLYLPYRQEWRLLGYSRGDLLNSIPLAPEEETTIEVFSWDRRRIEEELTVGEEQEFTFEARASRKHTAEAVNELQRLKDWRLTAGGKVGLPPIKGITLAGELSSETSTQVQSLNRVTTESITEASAQASAKLRVTRQTKVVQTTETGVETRVTRVIRNQNRCRTLTFDFFEVLADYRATTRSLPDQLRLALLLPDPFAQPFTREFVIAHTGTIRGALLDPDLKPGLDAAWWLAARQEWCDTHCSTTCACPDRDRPPGGGTTTGGAGTAGTGTGGPAAATGLGLAQADLERAITRVVASIRTLRTADFKSLERAEDIGIHDERAVLEYRRWMFRIYGLNWFNPGFWAACLLYEADAGPVRPQDVAAAKESALNALDALGPATGPLRELVENTDYKPSAADTSPERLERLLAAAESAWLETVIRGTFIAGVIPGLLPAVMLADWTLRVADSNAANPVRFIDEFGFDDAGLGVHLGQAREALTRFNDAKEAQIIGAAGGAPPTGDIDVPMKDVVGTVPAPPEPFPVEEMARHAVAFRALQAHMEENRSHYRMAIWQAMSPADRAAQLALWGDLGDMVDNEVLGFVGDKVAVPFQTWRVGGLSDVLAEIAADLKENEAPIERDLTLPTPGITVEGRLGKCDLCEPFIAEHRNLDVADRRHGVVLAEQRARQEQLEADRRRARLVANPPQLEPFDAPASE